MSIYAFLGGMFLGGLFGFFIGVVLSNSAYRERETEWLRGVKRSIADRENGDTTRIYPTGGRA